MYFLAHEHFKSVDQNEGHERLIPLFISTNVFYVGALSSFFYFYSTTRQWNGVNQKIRFDLSYQFKHTLMKCTATTMALRVKPLATSILKREKNSQIENLKNPHLYYLPV